MVNNRKSKQQAVVITGGAGGSTNNSKRSLKQLGVMINDKLKFGSYVGYEKGKHGDNGIVKDNVKWLGNSLE